MNNKTLIAVPCFDMVHTDFFESVVNLEKPDNTFLTVVKNTLIYTARNIVAANAIACGFDRVLWLDSDMTFPKDMIPRLADHIDAGVDIVTGLYFTRKPPIKPNIFDRFWWDTAEDGTLDAGATMFYRYPEDSVCEIQGAGMGCCLMTVDIIKRVADAYGSPFTPLDGVGEDLSFCWRARQLGAKMICDTSIKCGHVGQAVYDEAYYKRQGVYDE